MSSIPGSKLKEWRVSKNWSQDHLAKAIGVHQTTIGKWEAGDRTPRPDERRRLAKVVGNDFFLNPIFESSLDYEDGLRDFIKAIDPETLAFKTGIPLDLLRYFANNEALPTSEQVDTILEALEIPETMLHPSLSYDEWESFVPTTGTRIRWIRLERRCSLETTAQTLNIDPYILMAAESHPEFPWHKFEQLLIDFSNIFQINIGWLLHGEGEYNRNDLEKQP